MNIVVVGTSEFTIQSARAVLDLGQKLSAVVSMPESCLPLNSANIKEFCLQHKVPFYEFEDLNDSAVLDIFRGLSPDFIFSSWPRLLCREFLQIPKNFVVGSHPTDLPYNRGRHPLHWIIILGMKRTTLTFFRMDEGVDSGAILLQLPLEGSAGDAISDLAVRVNGAAYEGVRILIDRFLGPGCPEVAQNQGEANYWRKRTVHDVIIDLRMPAEYILRIVRSFSAPYPCANLIFESFVIKISRAVVLPGLFPQEHLSRLEPGKIVEVSESFIRVKCGDEIVELGTKTSFPEAIKRAKYIHPPTKYFIDWSTELRALIS